MSLTRTQRVFLVLAAVMVMAQLALFFPLDAQIKPLSRAVYQYESDDIIEISLRDDPNPMSRYSVWVALAEIAPRSTLYLPVNSDRADPHRAYGFGLADDVVVIPNTNPAVPDDFEFMPYVVAQGPGAHKGPPWFIALDPDNVPGGDPTDPEGFLTRAIAHGNRGSNPGPPREFAVLRWRGAPVNEAAKEEYNYYTLLMEVSLLTDAERAHYGIPATEGDES